MTPGQVERASYAIAAMRPKHHQEKQRFKDVMKARQAIEDRRYSPPAVDTPDQEMAKIHLYWSVESRESETIDHELTT